jgi:hypothetical protein
MTDHPSFSQQNLLSWKLRFLCCFRFSPWEAISGPNVAYSDRKTFFFVLLFVYSCLSFSKHQRKYWSLTSARDWTLATYCIQTSGLFELMPRLATADASSSVRDWPETRSADDELCLASSYARHGRAEENPQSQSRSTSVISRFPFPDIQESCFQMRPNENLASF